MPDFRGGVVMNPEDIREFVNYFPRGPRGSAQNIFRSGLYNALRNAFGGRPQVPRDIEYVYASVVSIIRHEVCPRFVPEVELSLPKVSGHPTSRAMARVRGCSHGNKQKEVHTGVQGGGGT